MSASSPRPLATRLAGRVRRLPLDLRLWTGGASRVDCRVRSATISIGVRSRMELMRVLTYERKEPETLDWIDRVVRQDDVVYDIGANVGLYSLYAAAAGARVYAFEPEALNFARLNENIVANRRSGQILAYPLGLSSALGLAELHLSEFVHGAALHAVREQGAAAGTPPAHLQGIAITSMDDLHGRFGLPAPAHVKVDVDGFEPAIIEGAVATLQDPRLRSLLIEINAGHESLALRIVAAGFRLVTRSADGNHVFERPA